MRGGGFGGSSGPPERSQQSGSWSVRAGSPGGAVPRAGEKPACGSDKAGGSGASGAAVENRGRVCGKEAGGLSVQGEFPGRMPERMPAVGERARKRWPERSRQAVGSCLSRGGRKRTGP